MIKCPLCKQETLEMCTTYGYDSKGNMVFQDYIWCKTCEAEYFPDVNSELSEYREAMDYAIKKAQDEDNYELKQILEDIKQKHYGIK